LVCYCSSIGPQLACSGTGDSADCRRPVHRNVTLRLLEPPALEDDGEDTGQPVVPTEVKRSQGASVVLEGVSVRAGGHTFSRELTSPSRKPRCHPSAPSRRWQVEPRRNSPRWHRPATGQVLVDGEPLDGWRLERLRWETAWVDPEVQVWNRSCSTTFTMVRPPALPPLVQVSEAADLRHVEKLLDGCKRCSVREVDLSQVERAVTRARDVRPGVRLVPWTSRPRARPRAAGVACPSSKAMVRPLFCITHDVSETGVFERVSWKQARSSRMAP